MPTADVASRFQITASPNFCDWLSEQGVGLAVSTYQSGKLFLLGVKPNGRLSAFERSFSRCLGLHADARGQTLWLTTQFQIWKLENRLAPGQTDDDFDRLFVPQVGFVTGDLDAHDIAADDAGTAVFANTLFSCLATVGERASFRPVWRPSFITQLAAEDRCHLNGLAMCEGKPKFVTVCGQTDTARGWRTARVDGGALLDVPANEAVVTELTMPHSPRWYRDRLWLLDSGRGWFGFADQHRGKFEPVAFCPGYARGLDFVGDWAIVGLSQPREQTFRGLPLDEQLAQRRVAPHCGLQVISLKNGETRHWLRFEGQIEELYDVAVLHGTRLPKAFGFQTDEIRRHVWCESASGPPMRWSAAEKPRDSAPDPSSRGDS